MKGSFKDIERFLRGEKGLSNKNSVLGNLATTRTIRDMVQYNLNLSSRSPLDPYHDYFLTPLQ